MQFVAQHYQMFAIIAAIICGFGTFHFVSLPMLRGYARRDTREALAELAVAIGPMISSEAVVGPTSSIGAPSARGTDIPHLNVEHAPMTSMDPADIMGMPLGPVWVDGAPDDMVEDKSDLVSQVSIHEDVLVEMEISVSLAVGLIVSLRETLGALSSCEEDIRQKIEQGMLDLLSAADGHLSEVAGVLHEATEMCTPQVE